MIDIFNIEMSENSVLFEMCIRDRTGILQRCFLGVKSSEASYTQETTL
jgi:hypothetical protein